MDYLLDTHTLIWFLEDNKKLSTKVKEIIEEERGNFFFSVVSLWEIAIKQNRGRLHVKKSMLALMQYLLSRGFLYASLSPIHIDCLKKLPDIHGDPFDRILIATATTDDLIILTKDENINKYDVDVFW